MMFWMQLEACLLTGGSTQGPPGQKGRPKTHTLAIAHASTPETDMGHTWHTPETHTDMFHGGTMRFRRLEVRTYTLVIPER